MKAAHGIGNMVLAHEIAVDGDVQLHRNEPPPDRLAKHLMFQKIFRQNCETFVSDSF